MRLVRRALVAILAIAGVSLAAAWLTLRASLPQLDGDQVVDGLRASVVVARDAQGVVTLTAADRLDLARATGFVHAQDRFFQMDLLRRDAAGELAELFGTALLAQDRKRRLFRMRATMRDMFDAMPPDDQALVQAYSDGVNRGLGALRARPFEYLLLGSAPQAWKPEDSLLVLATMFFGLSDSQGARDLTLATLREELPPSVVAFLNPLGTQWDAPMMGGAPSAPVPMPSADDYDLRRFGDADFALLAARAARPDSLPGSNNWAVGGAHVAGGGALVAGDIHLPYGVPHILYRTRFVVGDVERNGDGGDDIIGVTIPGVPFTILGSNRHIAWSLTTTYGDWTDLVTLELDPQNPARYRTPEGWREIERVEETLRVRKQDDQIEVVEQTIWGPVIRDAKGRAYAVRWLARVPGGLDMGFADVERARSVDTAIAAAQRAGLPPQNFTVGDREGRIGWTVSGRIPRRVGLDAAVPQSWADGAGWDGFIEPADYPVVIDPPQGRVWTANARVVDGEALERVGIGAYAIGARAQQIRDDLMAIEQATPMDMLAVQLDDRALFLQRWQALLLELLDPAALQDHPLRAQARALIESWGARSYRDSVGFRLVDEWRTRVHDAAFAALIAPCRQRTADCSYPMRMFQTEAPLWQLVTQRPAHLLNPRYVSWNAFLLAALDAMIEAYAAQPGGLPARSWGEINALRMAHPASKALPALSRFLDMPVEQQSGAPHMPRVQLAHMGSAERFAVTPGRERDGYFMMPGGQSGHPLSPYYRSSHADWMADRMTPFLPGPAARILRLQGEQPGPQRGGNAKP